MENMGVRKEMRLGEVMVKVEVDKEVEVEEEE